MKMSFGYPGITPGITVCNLEAKRVSSGHKKYREEQQCGLRCFQINWWKFKFPGTLLLCFLVSATEFHQCSWKKMKFVWSGTDEQLRICIQFSPLEMHRWFRREAKTKDDSSCAQQGLKSFRVWFAGNFADKIQKKTNTPLSSSKGR